ncbi:hypothetical protein [Streptomyces humicola]|nr:hypothetical protein [Streptomyces humicola]
MQPGNRPLLLAGARQEPCHAPCVHRDPRKQWPPHAKKLFDHLAALYGEDDPLPTVAAGWVAHQRSANT